MLTKPADIAIHRKFQAAVDSLSLRFPIAEIARKTKANKSNVSKYYRGIVPISQKFLQRFYKAFFPNEFKEHKHNLTTAIPRKISKPSDIDRWKRFRAEVDSLKLRFPVSEIAKKTKESKGNVTNYYHGAIPIGESFLKRFLHAFFTDRPIDDFNRGPLIEPEIGLWKREAENSVIKQLKKENQYLKDENAFLRSVINETLQHIIDKMKIQIQ